ncbi:MAG: F0F1 ATP synthase subunit beta, partial [Patescibacteria group bacterium]
MNKGTISQVIGVVVDVTFPDKLPNLYSALETKMPDGKKLVLEVEQHIGSSVVRTVAMS